MTLIQKWLKDEGRSAAWIGKKTGYTYGYAYSGIAGGRAMSLAFCERVAEVIGMPVEVLFDEHGVAKRAE